MAWTAANFHRDALRERGLMGASGKDIPDVAYQRIQDWQDKCAQEDRAEIDAIMGWPDGRGLALLDEIFSEAELVVRQARYDRKKKHKDGPYQSDEVTDEELLRLFSTRKK